MKITVVIIGYTNIVYYVQANREKTKLREIEIEDSDNKNHYTVYVERRARNEINPGYSLSIEVDSDISSHYVKQSYPLYKIKDKGVQIPVKLDKFETSKELVQELSTNPSNYRVVLKNQGQVYSTLFERLGIQWVHTSNA